MAVHEVDKYVVSSSKRKEQEEKMKLNELIRAKSKWTSILFVARFIGGFSGAKGWNQGYGYGQSGGYYGTNYDGSSKVHFVLFCFLHKKPFHSRISIDRASYNN